MRSKRNLFAIYTGPTIVEPVTKWLLHILPSCGAYPGTGRVWLVTHALDEHDIRAILRFKFSGFTVRDIRRHAA